MAATTPICDFGWPAKDFDLEGVDGKRHTLDDVRGEKGTLVMFLCNHCPYVKAVIDDLIAGVTELAGEGVGAVAIMSNDTDGYPADSFENMAAWSREKGFSFPYLIDSSQEVARAYDAVCTPDFFGFDADLGLQYRGRIAELRNLGPLPGGRRELFEAMKDIAATGKGPRDQVPSMGCSIKWRA
jgi:peroxiredoxin